MKERDYLSADIAEQNSMYLLMLNDCSTVETAVFADKT